MEQALQTKTARMKLILAMVIFGTIGIFRKYIPLPSGMLAMCRGFIGAGFLLLLVKIQRKGISLPAIQKNWKLLLLSGALIGFNWILLFEAYRYTSVATATLCYYMAPVFVMIASPFLLRERLTRRKWVCVAVACCGMVMVSGILEAGFSGSGEMIGVLLGLGAATLYAMVVILNQKIRDISAYDKTMVQLSAAAGVLVPYVLLMETGQPLEATPLMMGMMLVVGIVHTGLAYALYFGSMTVLKAQTVALYSYIDPIVAVILSALVLREQVGVWGWIGAVLILGATCVSDLPERSKKEKEERG